MPEKFHLVRTRLKKYGIFHASEPTKKVNLKQVSICGISVTPQLAMENKGDVHEKFSYQYKYSPNSKIYTNGPNGLKFGMLGAFGC